VCIAYLKHHGNPRAGLALSPTVDVFSLSFFLFFFTFSLSGKDTFSINNRFIWWSEEERTWGGVQSFWLEIREEEWPIERITNERDSPHQRRACSDSVSRCCRAQCHDTMGCVLNSTGPELLLQLEALRSTAQQLAQLYQLSGKKKVRYVLFPSLNCSCNININNNNSLIAVLYIDHPS